MKAEDTVMSPGEVAHILFQCRGTVKDARQEVGLAQAKISFKTGIKEVLDWLDENPASKMFITHEDAQEYEEKWNARLKEWVLTPHLVRADELERNIASHDEGWASGVAVGRKDMQREWIDEPTERGEYWVSPLIVASFGELLHNRPRILRVIDYDRPDRGLEVDYDTNSIPVKQFCKEYYPKAKWMFIPEPEPPKSGTFKEGE